MLDFSTFCSKHSFDYAYAKRFRYSVSLESSPRFASPNHPRLRHGGSALFDALAAIALSSDLPFDWNGLPEKDRSVEFERAIAGSKSIGLYYGFVVAIRLSSNVAYVWELSRARAASTADNKAAVPEIIGELYILSADDNAKRTSQPVLQMTPREAEVLDWCKKGKSYAEIGQILAISNKTVDYHMTNAMRKLGVNDKLTAILEAIRNDIISL